MKLTRSPNRSEITPPIVGPIASGKNVAAWTRPIAWAIRSRGPTEIASAIAIGVKPANSPITTRAPNSQ
jgi:hypothetical protein